MTQSEAAVRQNLPSRNSYDLALTRKLQYMEASRPGDVPPLLAELFLTPEISDGKHAFRFLAEKLKTAGSIPMTPQQKSLERDLKMQEQMRETLCALYLQMEKLFDGSTPPSKLVEDQENIRKLAQSITSLTGSYLDECLRLERKSRQIAVSSETDLLAVRGSAGCLVAQSKQDSRVLLGTDAGGGKTTLLAMIALYYSSDEYKNGLPRYAEASESSKGSVLAVRRYLYPLEQTPRPLIPCLLRLRDYAGRNSLDAEIRNSIQALLPELSAEEVRSRCTLWMPDFILLIDGLDELSAEKRPYFLEQLEEYLNAHPDTPVILTSRAAGLSEGGSAKALAAMRFQCRSILPLSDQAVQSYVKRWIHRMRPEREKALMRNLALIFSERRYAYLREFTHTPLDLLTFLNLLSEGTVAPSRYRMLSESLWKKFTGHETDFSRRQHLYTDTMNLLGLIAYRMQAEQKLSITTSELDEMRDALNHLNYYSDLVGTGSLEDYRAFLNLLAANTGVVDEPREGEYEFPLRTCQEFLAAYACCHLKPEPSMVAPNPRAAVEAHATDEGWFGVICFVLSDLESSNPRLFRELLTLLFQKRTESPDTALLLPLVDADLPVSGRDAAIVCEHCFQQGFFSWQKRELLAACMKSESAGVYLQAMETAWYERPDDSALPSCGLALVIRDTLAGQSSLDYARYLFFQREPKSTRLGCFLLHLVSMNPTVKSMSGLSKLFWEQAKDFQVTEPILAELMTEAKKTFNFYAIRILADLQITGESPNAPLHDFLLSNQTVLSLLERLYNMAESVSGVYRNLLNRRADVRFDLVHTAILALGSLPLSDSVSTLLAERMAESLRWENPSPGSKKETRLKYRYCADIQAFIRFWGPHDPEDRIAWAVAGLLWDGDVDYFRNLWNAEFADGSFLNSKNPAPLREERHYERIREAVRQLLSS